MRRAALLVVLLAQSWPRRRSGARQAQTGPRPPQPLPASRLRSPDRGAARSSCARRRSCRARPIGKGITGALRVTLSDGTLTHDAAFQAVAQESLGACDRGRSAPARLRFVDHYRYNLAAWRLAALLGLGPHDAAPPSSATIEGKPGALSWWVDDVLMDEEERREDKTRSRRAARSAGAAERQRMIGLRRAGARHRPQQGQRGLHERLAAHHARLHARVPAQTRSCWHRRRCTTCDRALLGRRCGR